MSDVDGRVNGRERGDIESKRSTWVVPFPMSTGGKGSEVRDGVTGATNKGDHVVEAGDIGYPVVMVWHREIV